MRGCRVGGVQGRQEECVAKLREGLPSDDAEAKKGTCTLRRMRKDAPEGRNENGQPDASSKREGACKRAAASVSAGRHCERGLCNPQRSPTGYRAGAGGLAWGCRRQRTELGNPPPPPLPSPWSTPAWLCHAGVLPTMTGPLGQSVVLAPHRQGEGHALPGVVPHAVATAALGLSGRAPPNRADERAARPVGDPDGVKRRRSLPVTRACPLRPRLTVLLYTKITESTALAAITAHSRGIRNSRQGTT